LREYVTGLFTLLSLLSLFVLVAAAYQTYWRGLEYARMKDLACTLATQFCMGEKPAVLPENLPLEGTYEWGRENYKFRIWVLTSRETGPANLPPHSVEVEVPALAGGAPAKLRVVVWK
jgi:hypothetical protein